MPHDTEGTITAPGGEVWCRIAGADAPGVLLLVAHEGPGELLKCSDLAG